MDIPELKTQNLKFRTHSIGLIVDGTEQETGFLIDLFFLEFWKLTKGLQ